MKVIGGITVGLSCLGLYALFGAQALAEEPPAGQDEPSQLIRLAQEEPGEAAEEEAKEEEAKKEEEERPTSRSAAPERFVPTEKISADSAVSFPVDI